MRLTPQQKLDRASASIERKLDQILKNFVAGSKLTLVVLPPAGVDGSQDFVITNDELDNAIAALQRRKERGHEAA